MSEVEMTHSIKPERFEVVGFGDDDKAVRKRLIETSELCRRAANLYYESWLAWHIKNKSSVKIEASNKKRSVAHKTADEFRKALFADLNARLPSMVNDKARKAAVAAAEKECIENRKRLLEEAGYCDVYCVSKACYKEIYDAISNRYKSIQIDVVTLMMNTIGKTLRERKSKKGSLPGWQSILLHEEGMPMFTRQYPIPFDKKNGKLFADGTNRYIILKTCRVEVDGKEVMKAIPDRLTLRTGGHSCRQHLVKFDKIASGEWQFKGSQLIYDRNNNKFFVSLCCSRPSHVVSLDYSKTAYVVPGRSVPFYIRTFGIKRHQWLFGDGRTILEFRNRCQMQRFQLNYGKRKSVTMRGGHGRKAAMKNQERVSRKWREFTKRVNHQVSKNAVDFCKTHGIGNLVYFQPYGKTAESRVVSGDSGTSTAWKGSTWTFDDLETKLNYKCKDAGIKPHSVPCGKGSGSDDANGSVPSKTTGPLAGSKVGKTKQVKKSK